ncbi:hypothetical protein MWU49_07080 [Alcanivorax sp. S6407]|uniref:hypothetical protein n=1 Tax=Alcanivorax sp. S6407 TaxID=2926424 RepID=UPI001FF25CBD|nr:hypothetical protein [Alcanivorax sp. S6407]MCK0153458.1 hypothetical protein [Alcanivorax sp. S6407]
MEQQIQGDMMLAACTRVAQLLLAGKPDQQIVNDLLSRGIDNASAWALIARQKAVIQEHKAAKAKKNVGLGALWLVVGLVVVVATFLSSSAVGHYMATWMVVWGTILFGCIQMLSGLGQWMSVQRSAE